MKKKINTTIIILLVLSIIPSMVFSLNSSIFCIADDGHVELEPINSDCCTDEEHSQIPTDFQDAADECSDCSDIEITNHIWSKRQTLDEITNINILCHSLVIDMHIFQNIPQNVLSIQNHNLVLRDNISHIAVSSTVILC